MAIRSSVFVVTLLVAAVDVACSSSSPSSPSSSPSSSSPSPSTTPSSSNDAASAPSVSCGTPKMGIYMAKMNVTKPCSWWQETDDTNDMRVNEDAVQYPHTDDVCADLIWDAANKCHATNTKCGPMKLNTGGESGWIGVGNIDITFSDETHFTGTITYDIGDKCKTELEIVSAERLPL